MLPMTEITTEDRDKDDLPFWTIKIKDNGNLPNTIEVDICGTNDSQVYMVMSKYEVESLINALKFYAERMIE